MTSPPPEPPSPDDQSAGQPSQQPYSQPYQQPYGQQSPPPDGMGNGWGPGEPPLDQPHYGVGLVAAVRRGFRKYATFTGRASRSEFWWWTLVVGGLLLVLGVAAGVIGTATSSDGGQTPGAPAIPLLILVFLVGLAVIVPNLAITVRRLHDGGFSGWLVLLSLIPSVGGLIVLVLAILPTQPAVARFDRPAPPIS